MALERAQPRHRAVLGVAPPEAVPILTAVGAARRSALRAVRQLAGASTRGRAQTLGRTAEGLGLRAAACARL